MPPETQPQAIRASVPRAGVEARASSPKPQRIPALDFTKGALVLLMVLYHWINYFIGPQWGYYQYLRFLTPSFIFITGFMISNVYLSKYDASDPRLSGRLFTRGIKLLAVFLFLNLARIFVVPLLATGDLVANPLTPGNLFAVFVSGNLPIVGGKLASFSILVPIGYLLMISGALMRPYKAYRYTFHLVCALLLISILVLALNSERSYNLEFITIGMLGVLTGLRPITVINDIVRHPYMLAFVYLLYTIAITMWGVPFLLVVVGVCLSLMVIYLLGISGRQSGALKNEVILLGKYSLFGYISQIAILQILSAGFRRIGLGLASLILSFIAAFVLTIVSVEAVDRARARTTTVDRLYRVVFA